MESSKLKSVERGASLPAGFGGLPHSSPNDLSPNASRLRAVRSQDRIVYVALLLVSLVWLGLIFAAPLLAAKGRVFSAMAIYRSLSGICHQLPARSFHLHGFPLAVCSRCTGVYVGFALGLMVYPFARS